MPVLTPSKGVVPLSSQWTHSQMLTHVRTMVGEYDSDVLQNFTIRQYINTAISQVAALLRTNADSLYDIVWEATTDGTIGTLPFVDLTIPVGQPAASASAGQRKIARPQKVTSTNFLPSNILAEIDKVTGYKTTAQAAATNVLTGNIAKRSVDELMALQNGMNTQYRQSMFYAWRHPIVYLFFGSELDSGLNVNLAAGKLYNRPLGVIIWGKRYPLLDNGLHPSDPDSTYETAVDLPDNYVRLALLIAQKLCLESMGKAIEPTAIQEIMALSQKVTENIGMDVQKELMNVRK